MLSTTPDEEYAAWNKFGLLQSRRTARQRVSHTHSARFGPNALDHREARERACVAAADEDPWRLPGCDRVAVGLRELHVLRKVLEVVDRLLDRVEAHARGREVVERVRESEVTVLEQDRRAALRLGELPVERAVRQVGGVR